MDEVRDARMEDVSGVGEALPLQLCLVGEQLRGDTELQGVCRVFQVAVHYSTSGEEFGEERQVRTVFVHPTFEGVVFEALAGRGRHLLGPPALRDLASRGAPLLVKRSPVFCLTLAGANIVFSGFRRKADIKAMLRQVQWCGGSVNKETGTKLTQLVAAHSMGEKYQYATTFSIPVLTEGWLAAAWARREEVGARATAREAMKGFRLPLFAGNVVQFFGFEAAELRHMQEVLPAEVEAAAGESCAVVRGEWFWRSIQIEAAANVAHHRWRREPSGVLSPNVSCGVQGGVFSPSTPLGGSTNKKRKRRRQAEMMVLLAAESPAHKRRSSVTDLANMNMSGSFLDATDPRVLEEAALAVTPEGSPARGAAAASTPAFDPVRATARQQVFHEFVTTETNYVSVLRSITRIAEEAEDATQQGGALLDPQEMKIIFGNMPPILRVHSEMLTKLVAAEEAWSESVTVGSIILGYASDLLKAYPPFVNFFERTKNQIRECDQRSVRFHAFLKMCERRPECSRQTLPELMIRPVQRLPSISLLLTDLLKHTRRADPHHPDCAELEVALAKIKEVMTHLNEEKRRTEGQIHIFDIYQEIENCPASVISSHRSFVARADCVEMAAENQLCGKGYELTLFLFTDILLVAKRKSNKALSISRSPSTASLAAAAGQGQGLLQTKALKFVKMIQLSSVRRLVDVLSTLEEGEEEGQAASSLIAVICRLTEDLRERMYVVQLLVDGQEDKLAFLRLLSRHVANTRQLLTTEELLARMASCELGLDAADLNVTSFTRAISSFQKTKQKVGRAFSFNKTPSKMKRAVSSMISPRTVPRALGESATLGRATPHRGMRELRLEDTPRSSRKASSLQSCSSLQGGFDSPLRGANRRLGLQPLGQVSESPGLENRDPDFRTPNLCSRPSFRDKLGLRAQDVRARAGTISGFGSRKHSAN